MYSIAMDRGASDSVDAQWIARCARRLRRHWPHADVASLDEAAIELSRVEFLREMAGEDAAEFWLEPLRSRPAGEIV